jgi:Cu/Ag efflux pump CusA
VVGWNARPNERAVRTLIDSAKQVGPLFFSLIIIVVVSFLRVFLLEAQEGRMFRPLAWTLNPLKANAPQHGLKYDGFVKVG